MGDYYKLIERMRQEILEARQDSEQEAGGEQNNLKKRKGYKYENKILGKGWGYNQQGNI